MLNISIGRRRLAMTGVRRNQLKLESRRPDSERITDLQHRRTIDAMTVQERPVTAVILQHALAILVSDRTVPPRHTGHVSGQDDKVTVPTILGSQDER